MFNRKLIRFFSSEDGAVTVDWVVLTAACVGLLAAGWGNLRDGTTDLADDTNSYMSSADPGEI